MRAFLRWCYWVMILCAYRVWLPLCFLPWVGVWMRARALRSRSQARALMRALRAMGPSCVKLGQMLSTRPDIVGPIVAGQLQLLQDRIPPFGFAKVASEIERATGHPWTSLFRSIEPVPVAAASIGQVHRAVTTEGKEVALKVVRPGVAKQLRADIAMFLWCARWADRWIPSLRRLRLVEVIRVFETSMRTELDMRLEASAASELRDYAATSEEGFYIPWVDWTRTASSFMTLEWIEGVSIYDVEALALAGHDPAVLAQRLAVGFFQQAYRDGVFHADPHPGNLLVRQDGKIALVDFGIVGRIDEPTRLYVTEILDGFLRRDYCRVAKLHQLAGYVPADQDMGLFAQALRAIGEPIVGQPVEKISVGSLLQQLFELTRQFDMQTQPQLLLLQKTTLLIESVGHQLYRHMNLWLLAEPWIESWVWDHLGVEARLKQRLSGMVEDWLRPEARVTAGGSVTTALAVPRGASEDRWPWLMLGGLVGGTMVWMVLRPETLAGWFAVIARMLG